MNIKNYCVSVDILGLEYTILRDRTREDLQAIARRDSDLLIIRIASDITTEQAESALLHEIVEDLNFRFEWGLTHSQICALEVTMFAVLKHNGVNLKPLLEVKQGD